MESHTNVYIGLVDILGFSNISENLDRLGNEPSTAIISGMLDSLGRLVNRSKNSNITWIRLQDGYLCYSHENNIDYLEDIIKDCCYLISMALTQAIPLRCAFTQGDIKIAHPPEGGLSVFGSGFKILTKLEKALDWIGGFLYITNLNDPNKIIQKLIKTTHLVIEQNYSKAKQHFIAPFKKEKELKIKFNNNNSWFLNWHKLLHLSEEDIRKQIEGCFSAIPTFPSNSFREEDLERLEKLEKGIKEKQKNSFDFANYCRQLYNAANLMYHSKIDKGIDIGKINDHR